MSIKWKCYGRKKENVSEMNMIERKQWKWKEGMNKRKYQRRRRKYEMTKERKKEMKAINQKMAAKRNCKNENIWYNEEEKMSINGKRRSLYVDEAMMKYVGRISPL